MIEEESGEAVIQEAFTICDGVCEFLGQDFEPAMLGSERSAAQLGDVPEWYWHQQVHKPINPKNPGKGRTNFTASEKEQVQRIIGEELSARGYPPATERPRPSEENKHR